MEMTIVLKISMALTIVQTKTNAKNIKDLDNQDLVPF